MNILKFYFVIFKLFLKGYSTSNVQKIIEDYKNKTMMLEFRTTALLFGMDTSLYSDEEIKQMVIKTSLKISKAGMSASEAGEALSRLCLGAANHKIQ